MIRPIAFTFAVLFVLVAIATSCVSLALGQGPYLDFGLQGWLIFVALKALGVTLVFAWRFSWLHFQVHRGDNP